MHQVIFFNIFISNKQETGKQKEQKFSMFIKGLKMFLTFKSINYFGTQETPCIFFSITNNLKQNNKKG